MKDSFDRRNKKILFLRLTCWVLKLTSHPEGQQDSLFNDVKFSFYKIKFPAGKNTIRPI